MTKPAQIDFFRSGDDDDDDDAPCHDAVAPKEGLASLVGRGLLKQRTILVCKPVDRDLMAAIVAQLLVMDAEDPKAPIKVIVNCPGGDADSGFGIYDCMKMISAPITTVCMGLAASAAIIIFLGGQKGRRFATPNSRFLIHQPSSSAQGQASDLEITAIQIIKTRDRYNNIIEFETGKLAKQIVKDAGRDFWLDAVEAKDYGLVDKIAVTATEMT